MWTQILLDMHDYNALAKHFWPKIEWEFWVISLIKVTHTFADLCFLCQWPGRVQDEYFLFISLFLSRAPWLCWSWHGTVQKERKVMGTSRTGTPGTARFRLPCVNSRRNIMVPKDTSLIRVAWNLNKPITKKEAFGNFLLRTHHKAKFIG